MEQQFFLDPDIAARYDDSSADMFDPELLEPTVELLAQLAAGGTRAALELGIGTGRIALPLVQRGVRVVGIDLSEPMISQLRQKAGGREIDVTLGSFRTTRVDGAFRLVYGVFNVFTTFTTQAEQVEAFGNAAAHVEPGGFLLAECWIPDLQRLPPGERVRAFDVSPGHLGFDEYEVVDQRCTSHHYIIEGSRILASGASHHRWLWPSELDLMARLFGLELHERWGTWKKEPFTSDSRNCISVFRAPR